MFVCSASTTTRINTSSRNLDSPIQKENTLFSLRLDIRTTNFFFFHQATKRISAAVVVVVVVAQKVAAAAAAATAGFFSSF